jgi:hypothetical protein
MNRTRASLYYLAGYLLFGGLGFLALPSLMLDLFLSNGSYNPVMVRFIGVLLLSLGIFIVQMIRYRLDVLYPTTLIVRSVILVTLIGLYLSSKDPMMLVLTGVVGLGFVLTSISLLRDKQAGEQPDETPPS